MNKDNAKDFLPLVQALADGKVIQWRNAPSDDWSDYMEGDNLTFCDKVDDYRIKPEPREWVLNMYHNGDLYAHRTMEEAKFSCSGSIYGVQQIRVREILD